MIHSKEDLKFYLTEDMKMMHKKSLPSIFSLDLVWKFIVNYRRFEYHHNANHFFRKKMYGFLHIRYGRKCGFTIPINVIDAGLRIDHFGLIVINDKAKLGRRCCIHQGVNIGENDMGKAPQIGNYVWIGPGAKLYGDIVIGDNINVGANAVVNKSFEEGNCTIAGVPAVKISDKWNNDNYFEWIKSESEKIDISMSKNITDKRQEIQ